MNRFDKLSKDTIMYIALTMDLPEILSYCRLSSRFNNTVCENKYFWSRRLKQDYNIDYLDIGDRYPKIYYQFFATSVNNIGHLSVRAMEQGHIDIAKYLLSRDDRREIDYNLVSIFAGGTGDMDIINTVLERGGDINRVLIGAIRSKHLDLIDKLIEMGANDWNGSLKMAILINNKELIERFIELGANNWNTALVYAINYTDDRDLIEKFMGLANNFRGALSTAIKNTNNRDLIERLIRLVPNDVNMRNNNLLAAIESTYNKDMVDRFIDMGADNWDSALISAISARDEQLVDRFVELGAFSWTRALKHSIFGRYDKMIDKITDYGIRGINNNTVDWNKVMPIAIISDRDDLVNRFIELGADDWNRALLEAAKNRDVKTVKFFIYKGANNLQQALEQSYSNVDKRVGNYIRSVIIRTNKTQK